MNNQKKHKPGLYERIINRTDKSRPPMLKEILNDYPFLADNYVLDLKLIGASELRTKISWSEKRANEESKKVKND